MFGRLRVVAAKSKKVKEIESEKKSRDGALKVDEDEKGSRQTEEERS